MPNDARLRGLTYWAPLYCDIKSELRSSEEDADGAVYEEHDHEKLYIGKVPIMLRSQYCALKGFSTSDLVYVSPGTPYLLGPHFH